MRKQTIHFDLDPERRTVTLEIHPSWFIPFYGITQAVKEQTGAQDVKKQGNKISWRVDVECDYPAHVTDAIQLVTSLTTLANAR